jgi:hypothetical protein
VKDYFHAELKELTELHRSHEWSQCLERCEKFKEVLSFLPADRDIFWNWTHFYIFTCHFYRKDFQSAWDYEKANSVFELSKRIKNHGYVSSVLIEVALKVEAFYKINEWVEKMLRSRLEGSDESEVNTGIRTSYQLILMTFKREIILEYFELLLRISHEYQRPSMSKIAEALKRSYQNADSKAA